MNSSENQFRLACVSSLRLSWSASARTISRPGKLHISMALNSKTQRALLFHIFNRKLERVLCEKKTETVRAFSFFSWKYQLMHIGSLFTADCFRKKSSKAPTKLAVWIIFFGQKCPFTFAEVDGAEMCFSVCCGFTIFGLTFCKFQPRFRVDYVKKMSFCLHTIVCLLAKSFDVDFRSHFELERVNKVLRNGKSCLRLGVDWQLQREKKSRQ